jgi:hypothetical protein
MFQISADLFYRRLREALLSASAARSEARVTAESHVNQGLGINAFLQAGMRIRLHTLA